MATKMATSRTYVIKQAYLEEQKHKCAFCGHPIASKTVSTIAEERKKKVRALTWEHVVPLCRGGYNSLCNCVLLCLPCNADKADRMPTEYEWRRASDIIWGVFGRVLGYAPKSAKTRALRYLKPSNGGI